MRLDLEDESLLESQSPICHKAFTGVLTAQRHRLPELARQAIIDEKVGTKDRTRDRYGRKSDQIDLERWLKVENVLTRRSTIR